LFYSRLSIGFLLQHVDSGECILARSEIMFSLINEAEQRKLRDLAVPRRQEGVQWTLSTAATAATSLMQRRFENCSIRPPAWKWLWNSKNYASRSVRVEPSRKLVISSHHAMFSTTAPQVD